MTTKFLTLELSEKTLLSPKLGDMILNSMTQIREMWDSHVLSRYDFRMVWRCPGIPCVHFCFFCLESKTYLDESGFRNCYGNFFESAILKVTLTQLCSKFLLNNYEAHWQQHFERHPIVEDLTYIDQDTC